MTERRSLLVLLFVAALPLLLANEAHAQDPNHACNNLGLPAICNVSAQPATVNTNQNLHVSWNGWQYSEYGVFLCTNLGNASQYCAYTNSIVATLVPRQPGNATSADVSLPACIPTGYYRALPAGWNGGVFDINWSNLLFVNQVLPCLTNVTTDTPAGQGFQTTVRWSVTSQTRYAIDLLDGNHNYLEPITGWVSSSGARTHPWTPRQNLPAGIYRVRVKVDNGSGVSSSETAPFNIVATPTVGNVTFEAVGSCFGSASTYAGKPVTVRWTSTNQQHWEIFRCSSQCFSTGVAGDGPDQAANWTPDPSLTGDFYLWVKVWANGFDRQEHSASTLQLRPRPAVSVEWASWNTHVPEATPTTNVAAVLSTQPAGAPLPDPVSIAYYTENETATAGVDYSRRTSDSNGPITFAQCQTSPPPAQLPSAINIAQDTNYEGDETFALVLSGAAGASVGQRSRHTFVIVDDDPAPVVSVNDVTVTEADAGTVAATFTVTLTGGNAQAVSYTVSTGGGTATAGADYASLAQGDSFPPGSGTRTRVYTVQVAADLLDEDDETFLLSLSGVQNAAVGHGQGLATIVDNDPLPVLSLQPVTVPEGTGSTSQALFRAVLTPASGRWVAGSYGSADGTAVAPADYAAVVSSFQIAPGQIGVDIPVTVVGDALHEANETFSLYLASPYNATISGTAGNAAATITDDDAPPRVAITDASTDEPWSGSVAGEWRVTLSAPSGLHVSVPFTTGACTATAGTDYTAAASGSLEFEEGVTSLPIPFTVLGETSVEGHEFFGARLGAPTGATLADDSGQAVILDNQAPVLAIVRSDFNGDGDNDVVWFDAGAGSYGVWFLKGLRRTDTATFDPPAPAAAGWALANVADFNGDNRPDLLWRNETSGRLVIWYMNGTTRTAAAIVDVTVDPTWTLVGTAPLDANGSPDLLWRNPATGELWVWLMDGFTRMEQRALTPSVPAAGWIPQFLGDLNADGSADLLLRNQNSGALVAWLMNGTVRVEGRVVPGLVVDSHWDPIGAFDADVDGTTDFAWQNRDDGKVFIGLMSGTVPRCGVSLVPEDAVSLGRRAFGPR
jgi:hypothetical protein